MSNASATASMSPNVDHSDGVLELTEDPGINYVPELPKRPQGNLHLQAFLAKLRHTEHEVNLVGGEGIEPILASHLKGLAPHVSVRVVFHGSSVTGSAIPGISDTNVTVIYAEDPSSPSHLTNTISIPDTGRLDVMDLSLKRAADPGSYRYDRSTQVPEIEFSIASQKVNIKANLRGVEEADHHIKRLVDDSPAYRDAVIFLKYFLHTRGLLGSGNDRISPFVLSLIVRFCFQHTFTGLISDHLTERDLIDVLFCFLSFQFDKWVITVDGEKTTRGWNMDAVYIQQFLGKGPRKGNAASSLLKTCWVKVKAAVLGLLSGMIDPARNEATWSELLTFPEAMIETRRRLAELTPDRFKDCLERKDQLARMRTLRKKKRPAEDPDASTTKPVSKRPRLHFPSDGEPYIEDGPTSSTWPPPEPQPQPPKPKPRATPAFIPRSLKKRSIRPTAQAPRPATNAPVPATQIVSDHIPPVTSARISTADSPPSLSCDTSHEPPPKVQSDAQILAAQFRKAHQKTSGANRKAANEVSEIDDPPESELTLGVCVDIAATAGWCTYTYSPTKLAVEHGYEPDGGPSCCVV